MKSICIIGAGPAGLMAAIRASECGASVTIVERGSAAGRKLLLTGGGRCNLTHAGDIEHFIQACKPFGNSLKPAFYTLSPKELLKFFNSRGLETVIEADGCVFPRTQRAVDVRKILMQEVSALGAKILFDCRVMKIEQRQESFLVHSENELLTFDAVIIATGGLSYPQTGSTGDGFQLAKSLGHTINKPVGILCPIVCKESWPGSLQGTSLEKASIVVRIAGKASVCTGAAVFTQNGIGGYAAFDVSRLAADFVRNARTLEATMDFVPDKSREQLESEFVKACAEHPRKEVFSLLASYVPKRVSEMLVKAAKVKYDTCCGQLKKEERKFLLRLLKETPLTIINNAPIEKATVTGGGVAGKEIAFKTMQSRLCPGLFFAGEVVDVDGPCGGYNLQIAFSTGALAGQSAAAYIAPGR